MIKQVIRISTLLLLCTTQLWCSESSVEYRKLWIMPIGPGSQGPIVPVDIPVQNYYDLNDFFEFVHEHVVAQHPNQPFYEYSNRGQHIIHIDANGQVQGRFNGEVFKESLHFRTIELMFYPRQPPVIYQPPPYQYYPPQPPPYYSEHPPPHIMP